MTAVNCGTLSNPANGRVSHTAGTTYGQPPTVVIQATTWWEAALAHVKLQDCGLGVHLPVQVNYFVK